MLMEFNYERYVVVIDDNFAVRVTEIQIKIFRYFRDKGKNMDRKFFADDAAFMRMMIRHPHQEWLY